MVGERCLVEVDARDGEASIGQSDVTFREAGSGVRHWGTVEMNTGVANGRLSKANGSLRRGERGRGAKGQSARLAEEAGSRRRGRRAEEAEGEVMLGKRAEDGCAPRVAARGRTGDGGD